MDPSGLRLGTPSVTSRGMQEGDMVAIADWIDRVLESPEVAGNLATVRAEIAEYCAKYPAPGIRLD
jgi:glycine hydroxymethyltransferase